MSNTIFIGENGVLHFAVNEYDVVDFSDVKGIAGLTELNEVCADEYWVKINTLIIPNHIKKIGSQFLRRANARKVVWSSSCDSIESNSFSETQLESIENISHIKEIGSNAFSSCTNLKEFDVPCGVDSIPEGCFLSCVELEKITGMEHITSIGVKAFRGCGKLKSFVWPSAITEIPEACFEYCTSLENIENVGAVTSIGDLAFRCTALSKMPNFDSLTSIGGGAFIGCDFEEIVCHDSIEYIGPEAFRGCKKLVKFDWPSLCPAIQKKCFKNCTNLRELNNVDMVTYIGQQAFFGCRSYDVNFPGDYLFEIMPGAFDGVKSIIKADKAI